MLLEVTVRFDMSGPGRNGASSVPPGPVSSSTDSPTPSLPPARGAFATGRELLLWIFKYGAPSLIQIVHRVLKRLLLGSYSYLQQLLAGDWGLLNAPLGLASSIKQALVALVYNRVTRGVLSLVSNLLRIEIHLQRYRESNEQGWPAAAAAVHTGVALLSGVAR